MKTFKLKISGIKKADLSSVIELVLDIGGDVSGLKRERDEGKKVRVIRNRATGVIKNPMLKLGKRVEGYTGLNHVCQLAAIKFFAGRSSGLQPRVKLTDYCKSQIPDRYRPTSVGPALSGLIKDGALVIVDKETK